jgi:hypothetical protein
VTATPVIMDSAIRTQNSLSIGVNLNTWDVDLAFSCPGTDTVRFTCVLRSPNGMTVSSTVKDLQYSAQRTLYDLTFASLGGQIAEHF